YCINAARNLFRADRTCQFDCVFRRQSLLEVQEMASALMRFPDDRLATFTASFGAADRSTFRVVGTKVVLKMDPAYEMVGNLKSEVIIGERIRNRHFQRVTN